MRDKVGWGREAAGSSQAMNSGLAAQGKMGSSAGAAGLGAGGYGGAASG